MTKVVFLNGPPGVGKTTAIKALLERFNGSPFHARELVPSDRGKAAVHTLLDLNIPIRGAEDYKDEKTALFYDRTPRDWYKFIMDAAEDFFGDALAGYLAVREMRHHAMTQLYFMDCGLTAAAEHVVAQVGYRNCMLLRIERPEHVWGGDRRHKIDLTSQFVKTVDIDNRNDLELFEMRVLNAVAKWLQVSVLKEDEEIDEDDL